LGQSVLNLVCYSNGIVHSSAWLSLCRIDVKIVCLLLRPFGAFFIVVYRIVIESSRVFF
jgi:hypothetical protein